MAPSSVLTFNPWMFSGADQLVENFFIELAAQLRLGPSKLQNIANTLDTYGEVLSPLGSIFGSIPVAGTIFALFGGATKAINNYYKNRRKGVAETRNKLANELRELPQPIVVILDDVDRLRTSEIRDIFKLVRLTANLPNVVYIVAFDRLRVEQALAEDGLPGRDYLEKIIQAPFDIPAVPSAMLSQQIISTINEVLSDIQNPGPLDEQRMRGIFQGVMLPLFRNVRDIRRYAASLPGTIRNLEGQVSLVDVLGLEAIRIFRPDIFDAIRARQDALTDSEEVMFFLQDLRDQVRKQQIETLLELAGPDKQLVTGLIAELFPAALRHIENQGYSPGVAREWSREKRVANPHVLAFYFERTASNRLKGSWAAEKLVHVIGDKQQLDSFAQGIGAEAWSNILKSLPTYEEQISLETAEIAASSLINHTSHLLRQEKEVHAPDGMRDAFGVVYHLLARLPTDKGRETAIRRILTDLNSIDDKLNFLLWIGPGEESGKQLVSDNVFAELARGLREEIQHAPGDKLAHESDVLHLLSWVFKTATASEQPITFQVTENLSRALVKAAVLIDPSRPVRSRGGLASKYVQRDFLMKVFGSKEAILDQIDAFQNAEGDLELIEAIKLVEQEFANTDAADI